MAIDTTEKKLSLMDFDEVMQAAVPYPDGSLDQGDHQHGLWSYSGIDFAATVTPTDVEPTPSFFIPQAKSHFIRSSSLDRSSFGFTLVIPPWLRGFRLAGG